MKKSDRAAEVRSKLGHPELKGHRGAHRDTTIGYDFFPTLPLHARSQMYAARCAFYVGRIDFNVEIHFVFADAADRDHYDASEPRLHLHWPAFRKKASLWP